jgi:hypothetical protein
VRLFSLGNFAKFSEIAQVFGQLFSTVNVMH